MFIQLHYYDQPNTNEDQECNFIYNNTYIMQCANAKSRRLYAMVA